MKKLLIFTGFLILAFTINLNAQRKPFKAKDLKTVIKSHQSFAILPFDVIVDAKKMPEGITAEMLKEGEIEKGFELQSTLYSKIVRKLRRKDLDIQDVDETNRILMKNGISSETILNYSPEELADLLNVDGIFKNKAKTIEPLTSKEKTIAQVKNAASKFLLGFGMGEKSKAKITFRLYNGQDSKLLWSWENDVKGGITNADDAIEGLVHIFVNKNPYKKK